MAVTWKVSDNVYQHIDVLELAKNNQAGKTTLKVGGRYSYSDLDELIVNHVKAMAKKVDEMTLHEKFQTTSKAETGKQFRFSDSCTRLTLYREVVDDVHRSQPEAIGLQLLHRFEAPGLLSLVLQGRSALPSAAMADQDHPQCLRTAEKHVSRYAGTLQWLQGTVHQHAKQQAEVKGSYHKRGEGLQQGKA